MSACALREGQQQGLTSFNAFRRAARSAPSQTFSGCFLTQSLTSVTAANGNVIDQAVAKSTAARVRDSLRLELRKSLIQSARKRKSLIQSEK